MPAALEFLRAKYGMKTETHTPLSDESLRAVQDILIQQLDAARDQLLPEARIMEDLGADSLDIAEISMMIEDRFNLVVPDDQWDGVETVEDLCEALSKMLSVA